MLNRLYKSNIFIQRKKVFCMANKSFTNVKIATTFKDYSAYDYNYAQTGENLLPNLVSGEQVGVSLGKIQRWIAERKDVIIGELSDGTGIIKSEYLPSYVDDVIEAYYDATTGKMYVDPAKETPIPVEEEYSLLTTEPADWETNYTDYYTYDESTGEYTAVPAAAEAPTWEADTYYRENEPGDGVRGKIYLDITTNPASAYRWTGTEYYNITGADIPEYGSDTAYGPGLVPDGTSVTADDRAVTYLNAAGEWTNTPYVGATAPEYVLQTEEPEDWSTNWTDYFELDAEDNYVPVEGDSAPTWAVDTYYTREAAEAGVVGFVPAPTASGYAAYEDQNNQFLCGDGTWSSAPVIEDDSLIINCTVQE